MRKPILLFLVLSAALVWCSDDTSTDGGSDATTDGPIIICDLDAFIASGGNGHACPRVSADICFPECEASITGGCVCSASAGGGPIWVCTQPTDCPCGNSSPVVDAECPDAGPDDSGDNFDADDGAIIDASDAGADADAD